MFGFRKKPSDRVLLDLVSAASLKAYQHYKQTGSFNESMIASEVSRVAALNNLKLTREQERTVMLASVGLEHKVESLKLIEKGFENSDEEILNLGISDFAVALQSVGIQLDVPQVHTWANRTRQKKLSQSIAHHKVDDTEVRKPPQKNHFEELTEEAIFSFYLNYVSDFTDTLRFLEWESNIDLVRTEIVSSMTMICSLIKDKQSHFAQIKKMIERFKKYQSAAGKPGIADKNTAVTLTIALILIALYKPDDTHSRYVFNKTSAFLSSSGEESELRDLQNELDNTFRKGLIKFSYSKYSQKEPPEINSTLDRDLGQFQHRWLFIKSSGHIIDLDSGRAYSPDKVRYNNIARGYELDDSEIQWLSEKEVFVQNV
jgi:hypothetical protein